MSTLKSLMIESGPWLASQTAHRVAKAVMAPVALVLLAGCGSDSTSPEMPANYPGSPDAIAASYRNAIETNDAGLYLSMLARTYLAVLPLDLVTALDLPATALTREQDAWAVQNIFSGQPSFNYLGQPVPAVSSCVLEEFAPIDQWSYVEEEGHPYRGTQRRDYTLALNVAYESLPTTAVQTVLRLYVASRDSVFPDQSVHPFCQLLCQEELSTGKMSATAQYWSSVKLGYFSNMPPTASFLVDPDSAGSDTEFAFDASSCHDPDGQDAQLLLRWLFEPQSAWTDWSSTRTATHRFSAPNSYTVLLQVQDPWGAVSEAEGEVLVEYPFPSTPDLLVDRFRRAYVGMDIGEYGGVLHPNFRFMFKPEDAVELPDDLLARDGELSVSYNMFSGEPRPQPSGPPEAGITRITMTTLARAGAWTAVHPSDPNFYEPEDAAHGRHESLQAPFLVQMYIERDLGSQLLVAGDAIFYVAAKDSLIGGMNSLYYQLRGHRDLTRSSYDKARPIEETSWGRIKILYQ